MFHESIYVIIQSIRDESSTNNKLAIIEQNADILKDILYYCYNPYLTYGFSKEILEQILESYELDAKPLFEDDSYDEMFVKLSRSNINNYIRMSVADKISKARYDVKDIISGILVKDLRLGVNVKSINKAIPDLIPTFDVQLAYPYEKYPLEDGELFSVSLKLNGIRGIYNKGLLYTRQGFVIEGSEFIGNIIRETFDKELYFFGREVNLDGELILIDSLRTGDDNVDFRTASKYVKLGEFDKLKYVVFDVFTMDDHYDAKYFTRINSLQDLFSNAKSDHISLVDVYYSGTDQNIIDEIMETYIKPNNQEGLIINRNVSYQRKRHSGVLKYKEFYNMDLRVVDVLEGTGRLKGTLGSLVVEFGNNTVKVGSGYSDNTRKILWDAREIIINRVIEVKYKEISTNAKTGLQSLQFPIFIRLRDEGKEVNYELWN